MSGKFNNTTNLFDKKNDYCFFYTDYIPDMFLVKGGYSKEKAIEIFKKYHKTELFEEIISSNIKEGDDLDFILNVDFYDEPVRERINYDEDSDSFVLSPRVDLRTGIQEAWVFYRTIDVSSLDLDEKDLEILEDIKETFKVGE